jgi:hypothetical protein
VILRTGKKKIKYEKEQKIGDIGMKGQMELINKT